MIRAVTTNYFHYRVSFWLFYMFNRLVITTIRWQKPVRPKVTSSNRFFCPTNNKTLHLPSEITKEKPQILKFKKMDELINESTDHRRCNCDVCVLMCFREMSVVYCTFSCWMMHYNLFRSHRVKPANISRFHYANRPPLLHSRQSVYVCVCVCVCVCVITHAWPLSLLHPSNSTSPPFWSLPL